MGNIGEPIKHIEFEPMPSTEPVHEPAYEPAPAQEPAQSEPVPA